MSHITLILNAANQLRHQEWELRGLGRVEAADRLALAIDALMWAAQVAS